MKVNDCFVLQEIADDYIVVPVGKAADYLHGVLKLNETGAFLWKKLMNDSLTKEELVDALMLEFKTEKTVAAADVDAFINELRKYRCICDENK